MDCYIITVHRTHSEQETTNENQEHQRPQSPLALLTSTSFAAGKNVNVEFRKGHSSAQYSGEIKGYDYDTYTFYAKRSESACEYL